MINCSQRLPQLTILGGCCGTDLRHIEQVALPVAVPQRTPMFNRIEELLKGVV
jgi:hypothetical protein